MLLVMSYLTGVSSFFFFSSRRRHTRYWRDWSSDVCSSDLRIVLALAFQYAEQMLDRSLAILGMNSADPFLVGLVGRVGRQAVNQQIFGGAAILDAVAEIDFETADAGDALDPHQLRLAFLQGAMSMV